MGVNGWKLVAAALAVLLLWFGSSLVRVENQRYALTVGMCSPRPPSPVPAVACLEKVQTRTGWWWHIYYALLP